MSRHGTRPASPRFLAAHGSAPHPRSGGAVIIIVLTLLSTMVFLGFFFFGFTDQASLAARSYAEADDSSGVIDPEAPTDLALEQLIVGTRSQYEESALWGGRHSILSHIVGPIDGNLRPLMDSMYAGGGMRMVLADSDANGNVDCYAMDYTGDGIADDLNGDSTPDHIAYTFNESDPPSARVFTPAGGLTLNFSRVAQPERRQDAFNSLSYGFTQGAPVSTALNPATGYTYPDLNSLFLSYEKSVNLLDAGTGNSRSVKMVVPSFFRPQLLLAERQGGSYSTQQMFEVTGAGVETLRPRMSLRPHERHRNLNGLPRFVTADTVAQSGDTSRLIKKFPFNVDRDKNLIENEFGLFTDATDSERDNATAAYPRSDFYEYDVDNDGDGRADSIWVDIGLPMIELTDGRQVVPLVAYKVTDADGLFNVNAHGNLTGLYFNSDTTTQTGFIDTNASGTQDMGELSVPFHRSNMGLGPGEINFSYGMFDDVAVLSAADRERLAREFLEMNMISNTGSERHVVSAVEAMFLLTGRVPYGNQQALAGRHGETNVLLDYLNGGPSITPPRAGRTNTVASPTPAQIAAADDDVDYQTSGGLGYRASNPNVNNIPTPPGVHPLPLNGGGISYLSSSASGGTRLLATPMTNNPSSWPDYRSGHWNDHNAPNNTPTTVGVLPYSRAGGGVFSLQTAGQVSTLDEDDELVTNQSYTSSSDAPFAPSENAALQLSKTDFELSGESSRLRELAPFNFGASPTVSGVSGQNGAEANRKLFTTDSWDRNEFNRTGLANEDLDFDGMLDANEDWNGNGVLDVYPRGWEFNVWNGATSPKFPPEFGGPSSRINAFSATDPLRSSLRSLLATGRGGLDATPSFEEARTRPQMPLNINRVLTGFDAKGNPLYRELVPHPQFTLADGAITLPAVAPAFNSISMASGNLPGRIAAEWWARNDRQNMARDIYSLLWFLSGGKDGNDYTNPSQLAVNAGAENGGTAGREDDHYDVLNGNVQSQIEARDRLREMAQFAVNVVDALDRDNVITEFRYDENLTDGWDISTTFQSVYGVEAAQLTLSEVLAIRTPKTGGGTSYDTALEYESTSTERYHLFVELKNASPYDVSIQNEEWRIRRIRSGAVAGLPDRFATLRDTVFTSATGATGHVGPGDLYLIGTQDGGNRFAAGQYRPSDFRVDRNNDTNFEVIVPNLNDVGAEPNNASTFANYPAPLCDLDLFANGTLGSHVGRYSPNTVNAAPTAQFSETDSLLNAADADAETGLTTGVLTNVTIVLERRLHNSGATITDGTGANANPWIEVDRMPNVPVQVFNITNGSSTPIDDLLDDLKSVERREPLHARTNLYNAPMGIPNNVWQQHTLPRIAKGQADERNSSLPTGTNYRHWQPHFDRDFASVMDLLSIPLYGYAPATTNPLGLYDPRLDRTSAGTDDTTGEARMFRAGGPTKNVVDLNGRMSGHRTAAMRFLFPEATPGANVLNLTTRSTGYDGVTPSSAIEIQKHFRNRWYRFLHFITVPDRSNERANQLVAFNGRTPGKLNLNTIRHEQVMAGLLDDPVHMNPLTYPTTSLTTDRLEPAARHWFNELQGFRDQADPILGAAYPASSGVTIPGNVNSVPFRPLAHLDNTGDLSITQTILRNRISSSDTNMDNILDTQPHGLFEARASTDVGTDAIDYHSRNRLLAKIHNRSTTRSNVFFVWTTIGFFDAHQPPFAGSAGYVTIGAQAEDLPMRRTFSVVDMSRLEEAYDDPDPTDSTPGTFDFRKFVIYRKQIK